MASPLNTAVMLVNSNIALPGFSENVRGTALGTADRAVGSETGRKINEDIAIKGREEFAEGMAKMRGHPPHPVEGAQGTGTGVAAVVGPTDQGQQQGEANMAEERSGAYSGPETTGAGAAQTSHEGRREAATGSGGYEQEKQVQRDPGFARTEEEKSYARDEQERSRNIDAGRDRAEQPSQPRADELGATGQVGRQSGQKGLEKNTGGLMNFQGIPQE